MPPANCKSADRAANEAASFITEDSNRTPSSYAKDIVRQNLYDEGGNMNLFDQMDDIGYTAPGFAATWIAGQLSPMVAAQDAEIPIKEYSKIRGTSVKNPYADSMTMGRYTSDKNSYIAKAGSDSSYFDMGPQWGAIQKKYNLTDKQMFELFNTPAIRDSIVSGKTLRFSHNPIDYESGSLVSEWEYIKSILNLTNADLINRGGFWYVQ